MMIPNHHSDYDRHPLTEFVHAVTWSNGAQRGWPLKIEHIGFNGFVGFNLVDPGYEELLEMMERTWYANYSRKDKAPQKHHGAPPLLDWVQQEVWWILMLRSIRRAYRTTDWGSISMWSFDGVRETPSPGTRIIRTLAHSANYSEHTPYYHQLVGQAAGTISHFDATAEHFYRTDERKYRRRVDQFFDDLAKVIIEHTAPYAQLETYKEITTDVADIQTYRSGLMQAFFLWWQGRFDPSLYPHLKV